MPYPLNRGLESLRKAAKRLLHAVQDGDPRALARLIAALGAQYDADAPITLRVVQHAIARELRFSGWTALKHAAQGPDFLPQQTVGAAAQDRYDAMAQALLDAYNTGTPEAMERHHRVTWHRRSWSAMRTYVQLDLGRLPASPGDDVPITIDDARLLVARETGFADWAALARHAAGVGNRTDVAAKPVVASAGLWPNAPLVRMSRDWQDIFAALREGGATGVMAEINDDIAERLSRIPSIESLQVSGPGLTDAGIRHLARLDGLKHLRLSGTNVTDETLAALAGLRFLESVSLARTAVTDRGVAHLVRCDALQEVDLEGTATGDGALRALAGKPHLRRLRTGREVTDGGLAALADYPALAVEPASVPAVVAVLFPEFVYSNWLRIAGKVTDAGFEHLRRLSGISSLSFDSEITLGAAGFAALEQLPSLDRLSIEATDDTMAHIARLPRLRHLSCQDTVAGDTGFAALSHSASLEGIWGRRCRNLGSAGFTALAAMPRLRALSVSCLNVSDDALARLPEFPALRELMPMDVPDDGYRHIGRCDELEALQLMYCRETGDRATEHITRLARLRRYFASYTHITDRSLELLSTMDSVEHIEIHGCPGITDAGVKRLTRLPKLASVIVETQNVSSGATEGFPPGVRVYFSPA